MQKPSEVDANKQWYYLPAHEVDPTFRKLHHISADSHTTYLKLIFVSPFDSQLIIEGDFPHARFMSYQILEPFDPRFPVTGNMGVMEVPIVDIDIDPDLGHVNPFRTGANRNATNRHYHLAFNLKAGNAADLNPVMKNRYFRAPGNVRVAGPFGSSGPFGNGVIIPSVLWVRYYAPDKNVGPLGGVSLPKALLKLKTGETFWIQSDFSLAAEREAGLVEGGYTLPREPSRYLGPEWGWFKRFGIYQMVCEGSYYKTVPYVHWPPTLSKKTILEHITVCFFTGPDMTHTGNIAHSATDCPYINYLIRVLQLGENKAYVLTGKLPTTPRTRNGEATMQKAHARYWSICHKGHGKDGKYQNAVYGCLMDDEITVDSDNRYIIVYSRGDEKPENAKPECGVTWQDFGTESSQGFSIRWMSVYPDHYMQEFSPNEDNIPWEVGAWSQDGYNKTLVGENKPGVMGPYHPTIHYVTKDEFENLGCPIDPERIPKWK